MNTRSQNTAIADSEPPIRRVRILDDTVVNQIAAGEVVERPASVVKELIENSIDAGATDITVVVANGGRSSIEVIDNGRGMSKEDALLAIERFGTSKIENVHDLQAIQTLGFRGEALPSIASVSKFILTTRSAAKTVGTQIRIEGGKLRDVQQLDLAPGTRVSVQQLFFNVPARRRFLRSETTEAGMIKAIVIDFACAYPKIRFRLVADGKDALVLSPTESIFQRIEQLRLVASRPIQIHYRTDGPSGPLAVEGAVSQPIEAVSGSAKLRLIINGRVVRDRLFLKAVHAGFGTFLKAGKYPSGVIGLRLRPEEVDVNVHPQKTEVRFRIPQAVFLAVSQALATALRGVSVTQAAQAEAFFRGGKTRGFEVAEKQPVEFVGAAGSSPQQIMLENHPSSPTDTSREALPIGISKMRFVGQIFSCYLLLEDRERFVIVDMHAAHERVTFSLFREQLEQGMLPAQLLLAPEVIEIEPQLLERFSEMKPFLERLGFDCDLFGEDSIVVRSVPALLRDGNAKSVFLDLFSLPPWSNWEGLVREQLEMVIARLSCHASVRSGVQLERAEVYQLLESVEDAVGKAFCPHGRPIARELTRYQFELLFGRSQ